MDEEKQREATPFDRNDARIKSTERLRISSDSREPSNQTHRFARWRVARNPCVRKAGEGQIGLKAPTGRRAQNASPGKAAGSITVGHQQVAVGAKFDRGMKKTTSKSQHQLSGREQPSGEKTTNISQQMHHRANEIGGRERFNTDQVGARARVRTNPSCSGCRTS